MIPLLATLTVSVDPRFELLYALFRGAGAEEYTRSIPTSPYTEALDARVAGRADHRALRRLKALRAKQGVGFDAPGRLAVYLDDRLLPVAPLRSPGLDPRWRPKGTVTSWLRDVRQFSEDIDFDGFLAEQRPLIEDAEATFRARLDPEDLPGWFEATFGRSPDIRVHPSPLTGNNNYGATGPDGAEIHAVIGLFRLDGRATFNDNQRDLVVHEASHGFAEPIVAAHPRLVVAATGAASVMKATLRQHHYSGGDTVANETITRAITLAFLHDRHPDRVWGQLANDETQGFSWIAEASDALLAARTGSRLDVDAAVAGVTAAISAWSARPEAERVPPFRGTINGASARATAVVVPASGPLTAYGTAMHDRFYATRARLITGDAPATGSVVAYGTPDSPWTARILAAAGAEVRADGVSVAG